MKKQDGFSLVEIILVIVILGIVGAAGWYVVKTNKNTAKTDTSTIATNKNETSKPTVTPESSPTPEPTPDWKKYCSTMEKSCFKYPSDWTYKVINDEMEAVDFTSPRGSVLSWTGAISGLGGACDPDVEPHVFNISVTPIPNLAGFYIIERGDKADTATGISIVIANSTPKTGDTGECLAYPFFQGKNSKVEGIKASSGLSATYSKVKNEDKATIKNIFLTYYY